MADPTTWRDVGLEFAKQFPASIAAAGVALGVIYKWVRDLKTNQKRIEEKNDGNHARALEEIKKAGKYEGVQEAKNDSRYDQEQILKAVEQVLAAQSKQRGRRRTDPAP